MTLFIYARLNAALSCSYYLSSVLMCLLCITKISLCRVNVLARRLLAAVGQHGNLIERDRTTRIMVYSGLNKSLISGRS